jgi:hypothetical protein
MIFGIDSETVMPPTGVELHENLIQFNPVTTTANHPKVQIGAKLHLIF